MSLQHSTTSPSLIDRVKANDADAWRRFVDLYGPLVFHWAKRLGLDDHASSDVLQEVFAAVAKAVGGFSQGGNGSSFRGWLWTITRNKVRDHHRAGANRELATGGTDAQRRLASLPDGLSDDADTNTAPGQLSGLYHRALELVRSEFEERTWNAFWRAAVENERTAEIARDLGITANGVRQAKSRVLRRLRDELGELPSRDC